MEPEIIRTQLTDNSKVYAVDLGSKVQVIECVDKDHAERLLVELSQAVDAW